MMVSSGMMFVDGKPFMKIGEISTIDYSSETVDAEPKEINFNREKEMSFTVNVKLTPSFNSIFIGRPITNNWLKLHGGVMRRKGAWKSENRRKAKD